MENLPPPTTQLSEVLYLLISRPIINGREIISETGILNPTARISDLRTKLNIDVQTEMIQVENKFGRVVRFGQWKIDNKESAIMKYINLVK